MKKFLTIVFIFFAHWLSAQGSDRFTVRNLNFNTSANEFGTVITGDGSVFYSKIAYKNQIELDETYANLYKGEIDPKGEIQKGLRFPANAIHAVFSKNGKTVYYSRKEDGKFQLFRAFVDETGRWKDELKLPFNNPVYNFKQPALNADDSKLFFASDRKDSFGHTDIYYVKISNHGLDFSEPVHLNYYVNSPGEEIFPHVGQGDKLYFASDGMGGVGGLDIFESFYDGNGNYEKTANMGEPINSEFDDFSLALVSGNNKGYFSSNRTGGKGGVDVYYFEDKKPTLNKCAGTLKGIVKNKQNKKPIFEAVVEIFDDNGNNGTTLTDQSGIFVFENVECELGYDIVSYKEGFNGFAEIHTKPSLNEEINLFLDPEIPEGFKEEIDFSNEMVALNPKTNEVIKPEAKKETPIVDKAKAAENTALADAQKAAEKQKAEERKKAAEEWDPLDFDPHSQPKKPTEQKVTSVEKPKEEKAVAQNDYYDPLDYDPQTQPKKSIEPKTSAVTKPKEEKAVAQNEDYYDPLDYDPHTQKNTPKKEVLKTPEEVQRQRQEAEAERQKMKEQAAAMSQKLKADEEEVKITAAQETAIRQQEFQKQKELQAQAIIEAKKRDEEARLEKERLQAEKIEKARREEMARIEAEKQEKARIEKQRQEALLAQREANERERQKRLAEAQAYTENLKKEEEIKKVEAVRQEEVRQQEIQKQKEIQAQSIAEAKKRDEAVQIEKQRLEAEKTEKARNEELAQIETEKQENARIEKQRQEALLAQREANEKERQKRLADAQTYAESLKKEEEVKQVAAAKQEQVRQQEIQKQKDLPDQAIAEVKKRDEILPVRTTESKTTLSNAANTYHTVEKGQGLYSIAKNNNLTVDELKSLNGLKDNTIYEGQKLLVKKAENNIVKNDTSPILATVTNTMTEKEKNELDRQKRIAEANALAEKLHQKQAENTIAVNDKKPVISENKSQSFVEKNPIVVKQEKKEETYDEGKSEQDNLEAKIAANKEAKRIAEEQQRLARIEKAKATAEQLKREKEQSQMPPANKVPVTTEKGVTNNVNGVCSKNIKGQVKNSLSKTGLDNVKIDMYFEGQSIESATTNSKGEFYFNNLDCNTKYTLICYKEGYDNITKATLDTHLDQNTITVMLEPNKNTAITSNSTTNPVEKNISNTTQRSVTENKVAAPTTTVKKPVQPEQKTDKRIEITREEGDYNLYDIAASQKVEVPKIENNRVVINPIYFDLDEYYLTLPARRELDKIVLLMKTNPTMIIESGSHTDTRGQFEYNLELSEKRSQETVGYLIANGVDPDRISGRGYGETMPVNHCLDGVKCSEKDHLQNRRTEFVILKY